MSDKPQDREARHVQLSVRLPEDLHRAVKAKCRSEGRTVAGVVAELGGLYVSGAVRVASVKPLGSCPRRQVPVRIPSGLHRDLRASCAAADRSVSAVTRELLRRYASGLIKVECAKPGAKPVRRPMLVRLPADLHADLVRRCALDGRSVSDVVRQLVDGYVRKAEQGAGGVRVDRGTPEQVIG